jgi:hypothetical protein
VEAQEAQVVGEVGNEATGDHVTEASDESLDNDSV